MKVKLYGKPIKVFGGFMHTF